MSEHAAAQQHKAARAIKAPLPVGLLQRNCACGGLPGLAEDADYSRRHPTSKRCSMHLTEPNMVPPIVDEVLRSPGLPIDPATRAFMEPRLGHDFSQVRIHADGRAAQSAQAVGALAYTVGREVVFATGRYSPRTSQGRRLLAHEFAHVIQQAGTTRTGEFQLGDPAGSFEREADRAAHEVASGATVSSAPVAAQPAQSILQRQTVPGSASTDPELSPAGASMIGSMTIDAFAFGKADLTEDHKKKLAEEASTLKRLLKQYPDSFVSIVGHTDAVGTDERNVTLGQKRAEAALTELTANGVPPEVMRASSLGETVLRIETQQQEPRNRRVEIHFTARNFFRPGIEPAPPPSLKGMPDIKLPERPPIYTPGPTPQPEWNRPIPPAPPTRDPIEEALDRDPLLRSLPKFVRDPLKDALKRGDEMLVDEAVDALNVDGKTKNAVKAAAKALLRILRGEKWKPPIPPLHEPPPSNAPPFPKMPGEVIIPGPTWRF